MALLFARQPIFNKLNTLYGYELLYREEGEKSFGSVDGDLATSNVMAAGFLTMGIAEIASHHKAFINFTENMILQGVATLFPKDQIVIELLETIDPTPEVVRACENLKKEGYTLALDDFVFRDGYDALINLADIIKIDFMITVSENERRDVIRRYGRKDLAFLAEKIESQADFQMAMKFGYELFQGFYFAKPVIVSKQGISPANVNHMQLMRVLNDDNIEINAITNIIERDVSFSYEILKIVNSTHYYRGNKIKDIHSAVMLMGLKEIKKWAFITAVRKVGGHHHDEILVFSVQRAKAMELLAERLKINERKTEYFTLGLLSLIDVMMGYPMDEVLAELSLSDEITAILNGGVDSSVISVVYQVVLSYEKGEWARVNELCQIIQLTIVDIGLVYFDAVTWTNRINMEE